MNVSSVHKLLPSQCLFNKQWNEVQKLVGSEIWFQFPQKERRLGEQEKITLKRVFGRIRQ